MSSHLNLSMMLGGGSTSTPAAAPAMPAEFPLGSVVDSGTLMLSADNEETAFVGAAASTSEVRSCRLAGGTPASTPLLNFRPLLPVINEEQHRLHQPLQHQQIITAVPRALDLTISSPPHGVEEASVSVPVATLTDPTAQRRDWAAIFRPREQMISYFERSNTPRRPVQRARRRRPAGDPAPVVNNLEAPQEQIQGDEEVVVARSSQEITTNFMANLLQKAADVVNASQHITKQPASATLAPLKNDNLPGLDANVKMVQVDDHAQPSFVKSRPNYESFFQQPRCSVADTTATAAEAVLDLACAPEKVLHPLAAASEPTDPTEKVTDFDTTIDILNISEINLEQPCLPTIEPMDLPSITSFAEFTEHQTDVQLLSGPPNRALSLCNLTAAKSNLSKEVVTGSKAECSRTVVASELVSLNECREDNSLYHRGSIEDLSYIVQHADMLRLLIDRQKELSVDKTQLSLNTECLESSSNGYLSMPAVKVYDPKIVVNLSEGKIRLVHGLFGALVMQPQVDMRSASFIQNRMDAAATFKLLLDLKAANIINLSKDGLIFSLQ